MRIAAVVVLAGLGASAAEPKLAANPLVGAPLFIEVQGLEDIVEKYTAKVCTIRPVTDTFEVKVNEKEICISSVQHMMGFHEFMPAASIMPMRIKIDGGMADTECHMLGDASLRMVEKGRIASKATHGPPREKRFQHQPPAPAIPGLGEKGFALLPRPWN